MKEIEEWREEQGCIDHIPPCKIPNEEIAPFLVMSPMVGQGGSSKIDEPTKWGAPRVIVTSGYAKSNQPDYKSAIKEAVDKTKEHGDDCFLVYRLIKVIRGNNDATAKIESVE